MKKLLSFLLSIMLILSVVPMGLFSITASAATSGTTGDCTWSLDGTVLTISGNGEMGNYDGSNPPWGTYITAVIIKYGVTSIGESAFEDCTGLTNITIPDGVTSIGESVFEDCTGLTSVTIPDSVTYIGKHAFSGCTGLTNITIPDSVTSIGSYAFYGCTGLTSITIPDSVTNIGNSVFSGCTGLTSITIPNNVTSVGTSAFYGCNSLADVYYGGSFASKAYNISIDTGNGNLIKAVWHYADTKDVLLYSFDDNRLTASVKDCAPWATVVEIPTTVTKDGKTYTVISIGLSAFYDCTGLTSVTIPDGVTSIGKSAFEGCTVLTNITIPDGVTSIDYRAFYGCTGLTSITIPDSVTNIGGYAFSGCTGLTSITIPDSVTSIGEYAFISCWGLTGITIGKGITSIDRYAFANCYKLVSVNIADIAAWCNIKFSDGMNLNSIDYTPSSTPFCNAGKLYLNGELVTDLIIPDGVTSIGANAFFNCSGLTSVTIPDSVTDIGRFAFNSTGLTSVTIGKGVTSIGEKAFVGCHKLTSVNITDIAAWCNIKFTSSPLVCGFGYGEKIDKKLYLNGGLVTDLVIPDGVTSIGNYAFINCSELKSVKIPDSVTNISKAAFENCSKLNKITLGSGVIRLPENLFKNCRSISKIFIPKEIFTIYNNTFADSNIITDIYYEGTEEEWKNVVIQHSNGSLATAKVHYNCTGLPKTPAKPESPILSKVSPTSVILVKTENCEYKMDYGKWQSSNVFTELAPNSTHKFYQRTAETDTAYASEPSEALTVTTLKNTVNAPSAPAVLSKTANSITLKGTSGYEYSADGKVWQNSNVFTGLNEDTEYTFYQRIAETKTAYASESSAALKVRTDKSYTPGDLDGDEKITDKDAIYLLMHSYFPDDYPVNQPLDYNNDGLINDKDAIYLLMHCYFPEDYPITK